ncbi:hypothetical protein E3O25_00615 [Cryobacterium sp. TMT1-3]|uniref:DUF7010 family protein n=1 Tax=Cryobacterium sp. TMT1-3 TaxID=1259237 RepID=UPI001069FE04|nr:hypothetical protein [Cryobacterium sp. TMT1-3]TFC31015.1 hypothetical protein E3O25_00615 [Cryobacterium sp. TMT1-3]
MQRRTSLGRGFTPSRFADPRRVGALAGLIGACVFVFSYADGFGEQFIDVAKISVVVVVVLGTLWFLFVRPQWLGETMSPKPWAIGVYLLCVVGELGLIRVGTEWLMVIGRAELRPAVIALIVGLHFVPFAWAFRERMFYVRGGALIILGGLGLLTNWAPAAAAGSGLVMTLLLLAQSTEFDAPIVVKR